MSKGTFFLLPLTVLLITVLALGFNVQILNARGGSVSPTSFEFSGVSSNRGYFGGYTKISEIMGGYAVVATDNLGGVYVAWQSLIWVENTSSYIQHVYFAFSHDYGETWSEGVRVNDDGNSSVFCDSPSMAINQQCGHIFVAWRDNRTGMVNVYIDKSIDRGVSFQTDVQVDSQDLLEGTGDIYSVSIAVGYDGRIFVVWCGVPAVPVSWIILFAYSDDNGETFTEGWRVNPIDYSAAFKFPVIAVDEEGVLYVAYSKLLYDMSHTCVHMVKSRGLNYTSGPPYEEPPWEDPVIVNSDSSAGYRGKKEILVCSNGDIHIVWTDGRAAPQGFDWDIYYAISRDEGSSFGPNFRVNDDPNNPSNTSLDWKYIQGTPSFAVDNDGGIHVVWEDFRNHIDLYTYCRDIYYASSKDGTPFSKNLKVNFNPDAISISCADPNMAIDSNDNLFIVHSDSPYGDVYDVYVYFTFVPGRTWRWPKFRHDQGNTGFSPLTAPKTNNTIWSYTTTGAVESSPAVADGIVFVGASNNLYALNETTGELIWNYSASGLIKVSPIVADGLVFVGSTDRYVYALNETNGGIFWNYTTDDAIVSSPTIANGMVFIGSNDSKLYALNETTGQLIWNFTSESSVECCPAVIGGLVFMGSGTKIYALNETTGSVVWQQNYTMMSSPAVTDGLVLFGSDAGVYALNESDGILVWEASTGASSHSSPAIAYGKVFFGCENNKIYALNETDGNLLWFYSTNNTVRSSPAVGDGLVFVGSDDGNLYALNETSGQLIWKYGTGGEVRSSPAIANGNVFVGSFDGKIYAFSPKHDVGVSFVETSKLVVGQGYSMFIKVTVDNFGEWHETFNVDVHYNGLAVSYSVMLLPLTSTTVTTLWNTTGIDKGNYTISAYARSVLGETDVTDNAFIDGWVFISIPGDINGDKFVNAKDAVKLGVVFGINWQDPDFNPNADINNDNWVNAKDAVILGIHFGQHWE